MKILYVTGASYPFLLAGENAYVAYSLTRELKELGEDVRVIMPKFSAIAEKFKEKMEKIAEVEVEVGDKKVILDVETQKLDGINYYFLKNEKYFNREKVFGEVDDCERFAVFSKGVLESLKFLDWVPEVIHCNNTVSALIPVYLEKIKKENTQKEGIYDEISTLFTLHSLKHQGIIDYSDFKEVLDLDEKKYFNDSIMKYYGGASILKGAVYFADMVNVVSANYLKEIMTSEVSGPLSGFFAYHKKKIVGIKNGIDSEIFDPKKDMSIVENYGYTTLEKRKQNKLAIQRELGLEIGSEIPIIAVLSKLDEARGINLLKEKFVELLKREVQLIIIGGGDEKYEDYFDYYSTVMPNRVYTEEFDFNSDKLSRKVLSAADFLLVISETDPCGIIGMLALRYGVVPIVRATGGLKEITNSENSFIFEEFSSEEMLDAIDQGLKIYREEPEKFLKIVIKGMRARNSWKISAKKYIELFKKIKRG